MQAHYGDDYKRRIGIQITFHDKDNANLRYPIKITYDDGAVVREIQAERQ